MSRAMIVGVGMTAFGGSAQGDHRGAPGKGGSIAAMQSM